MDYMHCRFAKNAKRPALDVREDQCFNNDLVDTARFRYP